MPQLSVLLEQRDGQCWISLIGEVDLSSVDQLRTALARAHGRVTIDCRDLAFIDASGIGALVELDNRNGSIGLRHVSPTFQKVLDPVGLTHLYDAAGATNK